MHRGDAASGVLAALVGVAVLFEARTFPPMPGQPIGPSLFPLLIGAWLIVSGAALIVTARRARSAGAGANDHGSERHAARPARGLVIVLADLLFYALAVNRLGFLVTAVIFLTVLFGAFGVRRGRILPLALGVTIAVHYAFYTLLRVPLPWGVLEGIAW
jgi:putative tricarboxylic transport membrane protein